MRVTFLAPHAKISGGMRAAYMHAHLLAKRGHTVTVAVPLAPSLKRFLGNWFVRKPRWMRTFAARILWVPAWEERNLPDADAVVATAWSSAEAAAFLSDRKGKKFYFTQHDEPLYHAKLPGHAAAAAATYALPFRKIAISSWLREVLREKHGSESEVIVTPVDHELFYPDPNLYTSDPNLRTHPNLQTEKKKTVRVLVLNHDAAWKGTAAGVRAVAEVKKQFPGVRLVLFGSREKRPSYPCDEYHFNPPQEKLRALYSSCHIYLCSSEWEGLGMPGMEAMACGAALVTYDTGGSRDYALDRRTAYVALHADFADLTRKLSEAVGNAQGREVIAAEGQRFIREHFASWERAAARFEEILLDTRFD